MHETEIGEKKSSGKGKTIKNNSIECILDSLERHADFVMNNCLEKLLTTIGSMLMLGWMFLWTFNDGFYRNLNW